MCHSFLIHSFTDGHLGCFQYLVIVNCTAVNIGVHRFFWIGVCEFLRYNPAMELLGQKAVPFLVFWGNFILFSTVAAPVCIPTSSALGFPFLYNLVVCWFMMAILTSVNWYLIVVLICIFLMAEHTFICLGAPLDVLLGDVSVQVLRPFFNWIVCLPGTELCEFFIYFADQTLVQTPVSLANIFFP